MGNLEFGIWKVAWVGFRLWLRQPVLYGSIGLICFAPLLLFFPTDALVGRTFADQLLESAISALSGAVLAVMISYAVTMELKGAPQSLADNFRFGFQRFYFSLATAIVFEVLFLPIDILEMTEFESPMAEGLTTVAVLIVILVFIPLFYLAPTIAVIEKRWPMQALRRSVGILSWRVLDVIAILSIQIFILISPALVFIIIASLLGWSMTDDVDRAFWSVFSVFYSAVAPVLVISAVYSFYSLTQTPEMDAAD